MTDAGEDSRFVKANDAHKNTLAAINSCHDNSTAFESKFETAFSQQGLGAMSAKNDKFSKLMEQNRRSIHVQVQGIPVGGSRECQENTTQVLLCRLIEMLIDHAERLSVAKREFLELHFDCEERFNRTFSPIQLFQRIDRAGKGHLTRKDILNFLQENGFGNTICPTDLKLVVKQTKTDYEQFVKLIVDKYADSKESVYFNERLVQADLVIRKIDKLPPSIEKALCHLLVE